MRLARGVKQSVLVPIFPDRDDKDETHEITINLRDVWSSTWQRKLPIKVIDQDRKDEGGIPVTVDFSFAKTGFFKDEKLQEIVYKSEMPDGRWLPTKGDLLFAQAIGYRLRPTSPFAPLTQAT